ncbi:HAD-IC family P-type ATPase [Tengunoibacter tsumagoiensis]|uniref:Cation transporter E1-E2 family ATPase n=1 Tax=Tengunoibacter tsumagoiensis TaxID=2014871 RepID=A0A402A1G5_9CHLR|nr:HAD-IC family P-type ATPase [Tengunoibacter tsumagoiensis]GCE12851.1 cation transporter E1-E2 family ATPase [Tengunoibacter tsumagoiensis]
MQQSSSDERPMMHQSFQGLSTQEAEAQRAAGKGAHMPPSTGRTYAQILREDVFTLINNILFVLCIALLLLGQYSEALVSAGVVLFNVIISVVQEVRAKRTLDRIALLTRPRATVMRNGQEQALDPSELVQNDLLLLHTGDQIVADGPVVGEGRLQVDESLLTGESEPITKKAGDWLSSGSFCLSGESYYRAERIGMTSVAGQLTSKARAFRRILTPLQQDITVIIQSLLLVALYIEIILILIALANRTAVVDVVRMSVIVVSIVPIGLFLATSVAYALGALRMAGKSALVQRLSAVESLSNVDVLCLDKTGTITTNALVLEQVYPVGIDEKQLRRLLALYISQTTSRNATSRAIEEAGNFQVSQEAFHVYEEVTFSSTWKWSALSCDRGDLQGIYILGAPEVLSPFLRSGTDLGTFAEDATRRGRRVLLFAFFPDLVPLQTSDTQPTLPTGLIPLGLISLRDELRHDVQKTLALFAEVGVQIKVMSGDHPQTVATLARQVGISNAEPVVTGSELDQMDDVRLMQVAEETTVFGRVTPQQKERLVRALRSHHHYIAMIGDGVNDLLSLKQANLGIAMESGSQATRGIADIILLNDSFGALPAAFAEGQRIRNGMESAMKLFLTRVMYLALLLLTVPMLGAFPFAPKQKALITFETVGIIAVALAAWAHPGPPSRRGLGHLLVHFVLPAAIPLSLIAFGIYLITFYQAYQQMNESLQDAQLVAQSALTTFAVCSGLLLVPFVVPPARFWVGGSELSGDWRPTLLAVGLLVVYLVVIAFPPLRTFFSLTALHPTDYLFIGAAALIWSILQRWIWHAHLLERFLQLRQRDTLPGE